MTTKTNSINDFFEIISNKQGKKMLDDLKKIKKKNLELFKKRLK